MVWKSNESEKLEMSNRLTLEFAVKGQTNHSRITSYSERAACGVGSQSYQLSKEKAEEQRGTMLYSPTKYAIRGTARERTRKKLCHNCDADPALVSKTGIFVDSRLLLRRELLKTRIMPKIPAYTLTFFFLVDPAKRWSAIGPLVSLTIATGL